MKKWLFSIVFLLVISGVKSQATFGFASHATPGLADTLIMNSDVTYGVTVKNTGTFPFSGTFTVYVGILDTNTFIPVVADSVNVSNGFFAPGDSSNVTISQNIDPLKFMDGNNTVVIWPAAPGHQTTDTIWKDIFVLYFFEIDELTENQLIIYPNPATDYIYIQTEAALEEVRIWDINGKLIFSVKSNMINVSGMSQGLYLIETETSNGKVLRKKIMIR